MSVSDGKNDPVSGVGKTPFMGPKTTFGLYLGFLKTTRILLKGQLQGQVRSGFFL